MKIKKIISPVLLAILFINLFSFGVYARGEGPVTEEYDSLYLHKDEVFWLDNKVSGRLSSVRIVLCDQVWLFSNSSNKSQMLNNISDLNLIYASSKGKGEYAVKSLVKLGDYDYSKKVEFDGDQYSALFDHSVLNMVGEKTKCTKKYCFTDSNGDGLTVYYVTNRGDYVHYVGKGYLNGEYLFPAKHYFKIAKAIENQSKYSSDNNFQMENYADLSQYRIGDEGFDLNEKYSLGGAFLLPSLDSTGLSFVILAILVLPLILNVPCVAVVLLVAFKITKKYKNINM